MLYSQKNYIQNSEKRIDNSEIRNYNIFIDKRIFTERLKESMKASGLKLAEIARQAEIPYPTLKNYLYMGRIPSMRNFCKLKYVLKFKADYLLQIGEYER